MTKESKSAARYREAENPALYRCQNCRFWVGSRAATTARTCRRVRGEWFRAANVCNEWEPR